jgi:aminoglycoside 3-N-acetyltransferase
MSEASLSLNDLVAAFRETGLQAGDSVVVHSSFRSLGPVEGGAEKVLDALLEVLTPSGNLMLPAFNYTRPLPHPHFDPETTPARTGIIPELGRRRADAVRSLHPTHSVAVIGESAHALTENHLQGRAFGVDSPLDRLAQNGGKILLIGVGQTSNSMIHVAEEHAGIPKVSSYDPLPHVKVLLPTGHTMLHQLDSSPSCSAAFEAAAYPLRRAGVVRDSRLGGTLMQLMKAGEVIDVIASLLSREPDALLCNDSGCISCCGTRTKLRA